jgi:hypothetical protein
MGAATARTEKKYSIPRNSLIPEQSVLDVLMSEPLLKTRDGKVEGFAMPLFRAGSDAGAQFSMQKRGVLYYFKYGHIYVYDEGKTAAAQMFEGATLAAGLVLPGLGEMAGGMSEVVKKGGEILLDTISEKINDGKHYPQATFGDQVAMLESRGMVLLPGVNLVDIEYQVEPAGFMSREVHRHILTYENTAHQRYKYQLGAPMKGNKSASAETVITIALNARKWAELSCLLRIVMNEFATGFDATQTEMQSAFEHQHGAGTAYRSAEFVKQLNERYETEIQRNGYNTQVGARRSLELLEPMRDIYDSTPVLQGMMQELRALAAGQAA